MGSLNPEINWAVGETTLYAALIEPKPPNEMENAVAKVALAMKNLDILGIKIQHGQIQFPALQAIINDKFRQNHPEALVPIIFESAKRILNSIKLLTSIGKSTKEFELYVQAEDIRSISKVTYVKGQYYAEYIKKEEYSTCTTYSADENARKELLSATVNEYLCYFKDWAKNKDRY